MADRRRIPMMDLSAEHAGYFDELREAVDSVLRSGYYIMGPDVRAFEEEVSAYLRVPHAVGCNSGTDALILSLRALGVGRGDEVITSPFTFFATAEAISVVGATPVFVDIDEATYNIDPALIPAAITDRTRALLPVHLYGQTADLDPLLAIAAEHSLVVLEDAAQAFGAQYRGRPAGTSGNCGAYSFFPTKPLGGIGDGGLVVTGDDEVADRVRSLRTHGSVRKYMNTEVGYNSRLDSIQAAALRVKLRHLDEATKARRRIAERYQERFTDALDVIVPFEAPESTHVFHQYTVRIPNGQRDQVVAALDEQGIASMIYYPVPVHRLPVYKSLPAVSLPRAERLAAEVVSLPISPAISLDEADEVAETVLGTLRDHRRGSQGT